VGRITNRPPAALGGHEVAGEQDPERGVSSAGAKGSECGELFTSKCGSPETEDDHRRIFAVLTVLETR
jgi:hypothetical protein